MSSKGRPSFLKRQKELARKQKNEDKRKRAEERKSDKGTRGDTPDGVDPDIAGIVPGPQPRPWDD